MWNLTSQNRMGLVRRAGLPAPLVFGSAVHAAFAANFEGKDPVEAAAEYLDVEFARYEELYKDVVGTGLSPEEVGPIDAIVDDVLTVVTRYFEFYGTEAPLGEDFEYVIVETTFAVPIPGTRNRIIGTYDGIARQKSTGHHWLVEHKTYTTKPNLDKLTTDPQMMTYLWAAERLFGVPLRGVLYDGVSKRVPKIRPRDIDTYFIRERVEFSRRAILEWEKFLQTVTREMSDPKTPILPNFQWMGCNDCNVRDLCKAIQFGDDVDYLIQTRYTRGDGHATVKRQANPKIQVSSFADLERAR
jgi:hypothetical protein